MSDLLYAAVACSAQDSNYAPWLIAKSRHPIEFGANYDGSSSDSAAQALHAAQLHCVFWESFRGHLGLFAYQQVSNVRRPFSWDGRQYPTRCVV